MVDSLLILFFIISIVSLFPFELNYKLKKIESIIFFVLLIIFIVFAGYRPENSDRDYGSYVIWFNKSRDTVEYSFIFLSDLVKTFGGDYKNFFLLYAVLGVTSKFYAIKKLGPLPILSLVLYLGNLYPLQELTQIRAGVATGLFLVAIYYKINKNIIYSCLFIAGAVFFHYSSIAVIPIIFLNTEKFNKVFFSSAILLSYGGSIFLNKILINSMDWMPAVIKWKILAYEYENGTEINIFNSWLLVRIGLCFFLIWNIGKLTDYSKNYIILLKIYVIGICSYVLLSFNPVFSVRVSDLYFAVEIVLLPSLYYLFREKFLAKLLVIFIGALFLYLQLFYLSIFSN